MKVLLTNALVALMGTTVVYADLYLQGAFPGRGSNNRLDEANRDRNNGNRLFDSQNNNRGGVNVGVMSVCAGSTVPIEFVNQHGARVPDRNVEIIAQYMVQDQSPHLRDGTVTKTIPEKQSDCRNKNCELDVKYGMHEDYTYYTKCKYRERNMGLFTADQQLRRMDARHTRQNPKGTRHGYECPEERDYYPYWAPTPWRDAFIMTDSTFKCNGYIAQSENNVGRGWCNISTKAIEDIVNGSQSEVADDGDEDGRRRLMNFQNIRVPNNPVGCLELEGMFLEEQDVFLTANWAVTAPWKEVDDDIPPLFCIPTPRTRTNHLGNKQGTVEYSGASWQVPKSLVDKKVVFRMRYNMTTMDFDQHTDYLRMEGVDALNNTRGEENIMNTDVYSQFGLNMEQGRARNYYVRNNPQVKALQHDEETGRFAGRFANYGSQGVDLRYQLAINTAQYGRTFQDRTHTFVVSDCGENPENIFHMGVRGKRGNIVQTFPSTEYDFSPPHLMVEEGQRVKIVMAGSNTNPNNNDGQGKRGTDRSNIVPLREILPSTSYYARGSVAGRSTTPITREAGTTCGTGTHLGNSYPTKDAFVPHGNYVPFMGLGAFEIFSLATSRVLNELNQLGGENSELDDWSTEFRTMLTAKLAGCWSFLSTRNNNFSNRSQKGYIEVAKKGTLLFGGGEETFTTGETPQELNFGKMKMEVAAAPTAAMQRTITMTPEWIDPESPTCTQTANGCEAWHIAMNEFVTDDMLTVEEKIMGTPDLWTTLPFEFGVMDVDVQHCPDQPGVDCSNPANYARISDQYKALNMQDVQINTKQGGTYVVSYGPNVAVILGSICGGLAFVLIIVGVVVFFRKNPEKWDNIVIRVKHVKRSFHKQI